MLKKVLLAVLLVAVFSNFLSAGNFEDEMKAQAPIILKALNHNKTLETKMKNNCVIAILYNPNSKKSKEIKEVVEDALKDNDDIKIFDKEIKIVGIEMTPRTKLEKNIILKKINAFWLSSDLQTYYNEIKKSAQYNQVITLSAERDLLSNEKVVMGARKAEKGYELLVNFGEAQNLNLDISPELEGTTVVKK